MFYIYSSVESSELYDSITFVNPYYRYVGSDELYNLNKTEIICETRTLSNFWDNFVCVELLPNKINIYFGANFDNKKEKEWEEGFQQLTDKGYFRPTAYILNECYPTVSDAADAVLHYCDTVAKTKATQYLLRGYK